MAESERKENMAAKLIAGLREKLSRKNTAASQKEKSAKDFPTPKDVAAVFNELVGQWDNSEEEMNTLYQFIDEWIAAKPQRDKKDN